MVPLKNLKAFFKDVFACNKFFCNLFSLASRLLDFSTSDISLPLISHLIFDDGVYFMNRQALQIKPDRKEPVICVFIHHFTGFMIKPIPRGRDRSVRWFFAR